MSKLNREHESGAEVGAPTWRHPLVNVLHRVDSMITRLDEWVLERTTQVIVAGAVLVAGILLLKAEMGRGTSTPLPPAESPTPLSDSIRTLPNTGIGLKTFW